MVLETHKVSSVGMLITSVDVNPLLRVASLTRDVLLEISRQAEQGVLTGGHRRTQQTQRKTQSYPGGEISDDRE